MRIEIDTNVDSKEAIRKAIKMLHDLVEDPYTNYESPKNQQSEGLFNMFGPAQGQNNTQNQPEGQSSGGLFEIFKTGNQQKEGIAPAKPAEGDGYYDEEHVLPKKQRLNVIKASDLHRKKFSFPEDQISVIDY